MEEKVAELRQAFKKDLTEVKHSKDVEQLKVKYLGKKGILQDLMMQLRTCTAEERPHFGKLINHMKQEVEELCAHALLSLNQIELAEKISLEKVDISLPGRKQFLGRKHPISLMLQEVIEIFEGMGFSVLFGPDIDSDYYNFEGLNYPPDHPARDMQDTYYITEDLLLRSQTSNTQLRAMESHQPPIRVIAPGTVYRNETISARSHVFFHQVEALYVDTAVSFADLLATIEMFLKKLFQDFVEIRVRPSYFPFTEPGVEVDIRCTSCLGSGCRLCKFTGWLEIAGAGMVHPEVLKNGGIDPEVYLGYAMGIGIERLAMLRYGVRDIRLFTENDMRFLMQF